MFALQLESVVRDLSTYSKFPGYFFLAYFTITHKGRSPGRSLLALDVIQLEINPAAVL